MKPTTRIWLGKKLDSGSELGVGEESRGRAVDHLVACTVVITTESLHRRLVHGRRAAWAQS